MIGWVVGLVALLVTLAALAAAAGHAGYLVLLASAGKKRAGGQPAVEFAKKRAPIAGVTLAVTALALLLSTGDSVGVDILAIALGAGGGAASVKALQSTQTRFRTGQY